MALAWPMAAAGLLAHASRARHTCSTRGHHTVDAGGGVTAGSSSGPNFDAVFTYGTDIEFGTSQARRQGRRLTLVAGQCRGSENISVVTPVDGEHRGGGGVFDGWAGELHWTSL
jgi:hypothetical protein